MPGSKRKSRRAPARRRGKARRVQPRRRRRSGRRSAGIGRLSVVLLLLLGFGGGFAFARHLVGLDRVVRARFEGRLFRVPSKVLSAPLLLYPGLELERIGLRATLAGLGYREVASPAELEPGRVHYAARSIRLHRRAFEHPTRAEPARDVRIALAGGRVVEIADAASGRELGALLLEPELVGAYYGPHREERELVEIEELPPHLVAAVLAVEDQRFLEHPGIDFTRILGAAWVNLRSGRVRQGGSTITQQLVKNFFLTPERSLRRKWQEAWMAILVEVRYEKPAILEAYLNEIYLGQRGATAIHGVGEASRHYFGKPAARLDLAEAALLAALIQSPNRLAPHRHAEAALARRDLVLRLMREQGRLSDTQLEAATEAPLELASQGRAPGEARYFLDALRRQLPEFYGGELLAAEGLRIYSTLDPRLQRAATQVVGEELERLERVYPALAAAGQSLQACLLALRPQTGAVLALVGGRSYGDSQFDRCSQARRPAGSVFKPFVYAAALEPGPDGPAITLASRLDDSPLEVTTRSGPWRPTNYDGEYYGTVAVREALERSLNVAAARLAQQLGPDRIAQMARRLGIESPLPRVPSLGIGSADLSPLELARAYATLAAGGVRAEVRTFEDVVASSGETVERQPIRFERVLDEGTAFLVTSLLEGAVERGTTRGVRATGVRGPIAAKTGTSDEERDAWLAGYTPELVVVVWVGFDEPRSLGLPASRVALPIFARFLHEATGGRIRGAFLPPSAVARVEIDPETGARALDGCPQRTAEWFLTGTEPEANCPAWARGPDEDGAIPRLGRWLSRWLERL